MSKFLNGDLVEVVDIKPTTCVGSMSGLLNKCGIVSSVPFLGPVRNAETIWVKHHGESGRWCWNPRCLALRARVGEKCRIAVPSDSDGVYGLSSVQWATVAQESLYVSHIDTVNPHWISRPELAIGVHTLGIWIPGCWVSMGPMSPVASEAPAQASVTERLYDAWKAHKDCSGLLREYRELTGRDRPGFMG